MNKDSNIRISLKDRRALRDLAKTEGRTLKKMFEVVVGYYREQMSANYEG